MILAEKKEMVFMTQQRSRRGKPPEGYVTALYARKRLGNISDGMLRTYIAKGLIRRLVPPGRSQGFYKREDVDLLARQLDDLGKTEHTGTKFQRATKEDIPEAVDLLIATFGGGDTSERRLSWLEKNPEVAYIVRSKDKVVGCAFILPLTVEKINTIFEDQGSASIASISAEDIQTIIPGSPAYLYIVSVGVKADSELAKRTRGQVLIRGLIKTLFDLGQRDIEIELIAGRSETRDGINLMRHAGFTEIESVTSNRNFIIEVGRSGIPEIVRYKKILHHKTLTNGDNQSFL